MAAHLRLQIGTGANEAGIGNLKACMYLLDLFIFIFLFFIFFFKTDPLENKGNFGKMVVQTSRGRNVATVRTWRNPCRWVFFLPVNRASFLGGLAFGYTLHLPAVFISQDG